MNKIQINGYTRITKKEAARRYNAGEVIRLTALQAVPVSRGLLLRRTTGKLHASQRGRVQHYNSPQP